MKYHWMSCHSRLCLRVAAASFVIALSLAAQSQTACPTRNIWMIVPSPTGDPSDIVARLLSDKLAASLGEQVIIDNPVRASQIIGSAIVAKAEPDGYTLLQAAAKMLISPITRAAPHHLAARMSEAYGPFLQVEINRWRASLAKKP